MQIDPKIQYLIQTITGQFEARTKIEARKHEVNYGMSLETSVDDTNVLWLSFVRGNEKQIITIPLPYEINGIKLIQHNEVTRAVCPFWLEKEQIELDYLATIYSIIMGTPTGIIPQDLIKPTPYLQQMVYAFRNNNASIIAYRFQKAINEVVNKMPLHETFMNSYVMNNRLIIIDEEFEALKSPEGRLEYQTKKAKKYYDRGWTAIGLSDGSLADKNYLLKTDIRKLSPFGIRYHNPQRNLYSTLGMQGDEFPCIRSVSMQQLIDKGITRTGWNFLTAFVDIPDVFEDQIMVDESHKDKFVEGERRYQLFGELLVKENQKIKTGTVLGISPDQQPVSFKVYCESASVKKIAEGYTSVGGVATKVYNVIISYKRNFKDGFKITNLHGNKGVIRLAKLGYATNPNTGKKEKIDVIVGGKTIGKRKNYGQVMEALLNCILEADNHTMPLVLDDGWWQPLEQIKTALTSKGYNSDGTWECDTYVGKVKAVCGKVFWGVIKTPEDQIWKPEATINRNGKEVRTAGLKFSHVEFRALETRLGKENPVLNEIMSYMQGTENVHEMLDMLRSKINEFPENKITLDTHSVKPVDQQISTIIPGQFINGTVVDEFFCSGGFIFRLPLPYQTIIDSKGKVIHEGSAMVYDQLPEDKRSEVKDVYTTDKLYFPSGTLRSCWRHDTGKYGLSEIGVIINNVVVMSQRLQADYENPLNHRLYYSAVSSYFNRLSQILGTKRGEISTYTMAVRYPFSAKATATLSNSLPANSVEIHRNMASILKVENGDIVLVERFPCLGFMSVRLQKIIITDDAMCKYTIRVSSNSLVSENLDFDGDVVYIASFHTPASKIALRKEWMNPNITCYREIQALNSRKGAPHIKEYDIDNFNIHPFGDMTCLEHASIVEKNTGVKAQTGPVIALTYNIMRLVEDSDLASDQKMKVAVEMFLEKAAQSVFEQKHGGKSLYEIVIDNICTANVENLVEVGFKRGTTEKLCALIVDRAHSLGIFDLQRFHSRAKARGGSNLISTIIRNRHKIYFASRSILEGTNLLKALSSPAVDVPSRMFKWATSGKADRIKVMLDEIINKEEIQKINNRKLKNACASLCEVVDVIFESRNIYTECSKRLRKSLKGGFGICQTYN